MLKDNVLLKEIPRALVFTSNFVFQKLVRRDHLKIFLGVSLAVVVVFRFFCFFFLFFFFCTFFFCFVFVPRGKSSVSSLGCSCCFFFFLKFLVGMSSSFWVFIHSRVQGSSMWDLKVFSVEVTNVGFKAF